MSNYPDSVDSFTPVTGTDLMSEHAERHTAEESAIVATQQELDATKVLLADKSDTDHTHPPQDLTHDHDGEYAKDDHVHDSDDDKLDKGTTTYVDAKAIQDDIDGIETSISELSDNYDQLVIDLGDAGADLNVELAGYLKKGTASYADAAGIEADIDQEKNDRANADKDLQDQIDLLENYDETALEGRVATNEGDITDIKAEQLTQDADIKQNADDIAALVIPDVSEFATKDEVADGDTATLTAAKTYTDDEIAKIPATDVSDLATKDELTAGLAGKADEPHTHDDLAAGDHNHNSDYSAVDHTHPPQDLTHDHDAEYQPVGDYATKTELSDGLDTKSDTTHVHDLTHDHQEYFLSGVEFDVDGNPLPLPYGDAKTLGEAVDGKSEETHNHDSDYQPLGDYATKTELKAVEDKADANTTKNSEQDGKIGDLESELESTGNKLDSLENAIITARYKLVTTLGGARDGELRVFSDEPTSITALDFNAKDADGNSHDFSQVKSGDIITVAQSSGVGSYKVSTISGESLSVEFISGNGTFVDQAIAEIVFSPEFDTSSYATITYVDAQDATKFNKGVTGPTTLTTAELMEAAIEANTTAIDEIDTSTLPLSEAVDVRAATLNTQKDANEYFAAEIETKLAKAPTWGELAGRS